MGLFSTLPLEQVEVYLPKKAGVGRFPMVGTAMDVRMRGRRGLSARSSGCTSVVSKLVDEFFFCIRCLDSMGFFWIGVLALASGLAVVCDFAAKRVERRIPFAFTISKCLRTVADLETEITC